MMKSNEALQKAGVLLALDGLHPPSMGARVSFAAATSKPSLDRGPIAVRAAHVREAAAHRMATPSTGMATSRVSVPLPRGNECIGGRAPN
jgi:hypothetical protein